MLRAFKRSRYIYYFNNYYRSGIINNWGYCISFLLRNQKIYIFFFYNINQENICKKIRNKENLTKSTKYLRHGIFASLFLLIGMLILIPSFFYKGSYVWAVRWTGSLLIFPSIGRMLITFYYHHPRFRNKKKILDDSTLFVAYGCIVQIIHALIFILYSPYPDFRDEMTIYLIGGIIFFILTFLMYYFDMKS